MRFRLIVKQDAERDIEKASAWYEKEEMGLGGRFLDAVNAALKKASLSPLSYQILERGVRRINLHRFPYSLFFRVEDDKVVIFCCVHHRRHPRVWKRRS